MSRRVADMGESDRTRGSGSEKLRRKISWVGDEMIVSAPCSAVLRREGASLANGAVMFVVSEVDGSVSGVGPAG